MDLRNQIRAIFAEFDPIEAELDTLMARRREVSRRYDAALAAFREANPAPPGWYWADVSGEMRLEQESPRCGYVYLSGDECGGDAVTWQADGEGRCETHKEG